MFLFVPFSVLATENTFSGIPAADYSNEFETVPSVVQDPINGYPLFWVEGLTPGGFFGVFAKSYFESSDVLQGANNFLYATIDKTDPNNKADNGYILIHERDVEDWIAYYGQTSKSEYTSYVKARLTPVTVDLGLSTETFYNHAQVAAVAGGQPGEYTVEPVRDSNGRIIDENNNNKPDWYRAVIRDIKVYDDHYKHSISMDMPTEAEVGQSENITLSTTEGSYYIMQQQYWNLVIATPSGGSVRLLTNHMVSPDLETHIAEQTITYIFPEAGTYTVRFIIQDSSYHTNDRTGTERYSISKEITITGKPPPPDPGPCTITIQPPINGRSASAESLDPSAMGMIRADARGAERFDVLQGIPTSETLYANAFGLNYLYKNEFQEKTGKITYSVPVQKTYILTWMQPIPPACPECPPTEMPMQDPVVVQENVPVERNYSYWQIDNLEIYSLAQATMSNYALPGGTVTITPTGYTPPERLRGKQIPLPGRIAAISDTYATLVTGRPFQKKKSTRETIDIMIRDQHLFDPDIHKTFLSIVKKVY